MKFHHLQKVFNENKTPGYALRKIENGVITFEESGGVRSNLFNEPVTAKDIWHIGSCTKSMTAFLIGILIDEKKLKFEESIGQVLSHPMSPEVKKLSIVNLLTHRSGLHDVTELSDQTSWFNSFKSKESTQKLRDRLVSTILLDKVKFSKDSQFDYTNSNYLILGAIIEKIENKPWEEVLEEKIFNKLGMDKCGFGPSASRGVTPPDQPWGHRVENEKLISIQPLLNEDENTYSDNPASLGPAGTVHCNFDSWSLFLKEMLLSSQGHSTLLSPRTAALLFQPYKDHIAYGGWGAIERDWARGLTYTMVGSNTLNYALFVIAPNRNMVLMGATNSGADESLKTLSEQIKKQVQP